LSENAKSDECIDIPFRERLPAARWRKPFDPQNPLFFPVNRVDGRRPRLGVGDRKIDKSLPILKHSATLLHSQHGLHFSDFRRINA
jgi:hypothetical protein